MEAWTTTWVPSYRDQIAVALPAASTPTAGVWADPPAADRSANRLVTGRQVGAAPAGGATSAAPTSPATTKKMKRVTTRVMLFPRALGAGLPDARLTL